MPKSGSFHVAVTLLIVATSFGCAQEMSPDAARELNQFIRGGFLIDIDIRGTVVDGDGTPLHGVKFTKTLYKKGKHYTQGVIDGEFVLREDDSLGVYLRLSKEGYYHKQVRFDPSFPGAVRSETSGTLIRADDLKIVMEAIGPATPMLPYENRIAYRTDAAARLMLVAENRAETVRLISERRRRVSLDLAKRPLAELPQGHVYVRASCVDGRIPHRSDALHIGESSYRAENLAKEAYLGVTGKDSEFILCEPTREDGSTLPEHLLRCLRDAPEEGYRKEILLDHHSRFVFFYCKVGDFYGKGYAGLPSLYSAEDGDRVEVMVWVYMQPDKTRNVRSME